MCISLRVPLSFPNTLHIKERSNIHIFRLALKFKPLARDQWSKSTCTKIARSLQFKPRRLPSPRRISSWLPRPSSHTEPSPSHPDLATFYPSPAQKQMHSIKSSMCSLNKVTKYRQKMRYSLILIEKPPLRHLQSSNPDWQL